MKATERLVLFYFFPPFFGSVLPREGGDGGGSGTGERFVSLLLQIVLLKAVSKTRWGGRRQIFHSMPPAPPLSSHSFFNIMFKDRNR